MYEHTGSQYHEHFFVHVLKLEIYIYLTLARHRSQLIGHQMFTPTLLSSSPAIRCWKGIIMGNLRFGGTAKLSQVAPAAMKAFIKPIP